MKFIYNNALKILIFVQLIFIFSCRTSKIPDNQHLFIGNKYTYIDKKGKPYVDEYGSPFFDMNGKLLLNTYKNPFSDELDGYVKQKPNKEILFVVPLKLWMFDISNPKFDSIYNDYYAVEQKRRNQKLLDSLYIRYDKEEYVGKSRWFDRFFYHNGEGPVLVDSLVSETSSENLKQYFKNRGWRKAKVSDTLLISGKKAKVQYNIKLGRPMIMDEVMYDIADEIGANLYAAYVRRRLIDTTQLGESQVDSLKNRLIGEFFSRGTLVKKGDRLDAYILGDEIARLENRFRNMGYYGFNDLKDEVIYYVDTANNVYNVPVRLSIKKSELKKGTPSDSIKTNRDNTIFKIYRYNKVNVILEGFKDKNGNEPPADSLFYVSKRRYSDQRGKRATRFDSIQIINKSGGRYKSRVLDDMIAIRIGDPYRINTETQTRRNIYKVNNFNILGFNTVPEANSDSTLVSNIILTPMDKYSYEIGFEAFSSGIVNFGITPNVTFTAKNLFGGAENLSISFGGSIGNIESKKNNDKLFNASELSAQASLSFPKLLVPFNAQKVIPRGWGPSSAITLGYNAQYNIGLDRRSYNAALAYNFTPTRTTVHQITLWNLQYTQFLNPDNYFTIYERDREVVEQVYDEYFTMYPEVKAEYESNLLTDNQLLAQIQNNSVFKDYLRGNRPALTDEYILVESRRYRFTQDVLISSFQYAFTYDQRLGFFPGKNPFYLKAQIELAGNALSIFNKSLKDFTTSHNKVVKEIFGVPYSQFIKLDLDLRKYWNLSGKKSVNARFFTGIGIPYGNSFALPFDRNYSVGGPSDVRAWKAFGFGPGTSKLGHKGGYELVALESFKLFSSVEYRFPFLSKGFEGALFVDAGNVWGIRKDSPDKFKFDSFYKELGIGGGWGVRWNISNFIIRFDFAYKFHDPRRDEGDRWYFKRINVLKPQINFAIDYPF